MESNDQFSGVFGTIVPDHDLCCERKRRGARMSRTRTIQKHVRWKSFEDIFYAMNVATIHGKTNFENQEQNDHTKDG